MENKQSLKPRYGIFHIFFAWRFAISGLWIAFKNENSFRYEVVVGALMILIACLSHKSKLEKLLMIGSIMLVYIVELINSAIEYTVDLVTDEYHVLAKCAKDVASAAVFLTILYGCVVWGWIFFVS